MKKPPPQGAQAALRVIRLLRVFSVERPELTLGELCAEVGLAKTTTHRLLAALESEGMVERSPVTGAYRLGSTILSMAAGVLNGDDLLTAVRPVLNSLARDTGETATLEVFADGEVLVLDEVAGTHLIAATRSVGSRWPLHATSTGKVLLAFSETARDELQDPPERFCPGTITDRNVLDRQIGEIRQRGFSVAAEELEEGFVAVAVPLWAGAGDLRGAISIGGPSRRLTVGRIEALALKLKAAADRLQAIPLRLAR